jgi:host factor-I protein
MVRGPNNHLSLTSPAISCQLKIRVVISLQTARSIIPPPGFSSMSDGKQAPQNIQDAFLNTVRREKTSVIVFLVNGAKLTGRIRSFDKFSVLLESGNQEQLIFKHAISTISQSRRATGELHSQATAEANPREVRTPDVNSPEA